MKGSYALYSDDVEIKPQYWPPILPRVDPLGLPHGVAYTPFKDPKDSKFGGAGSWPHPYWARGAVYLSHIELRALFAFCFDPRVVDVREQYPMVNKQKLAATFAASRRIREVDLPTVDFVLTVRDNARDTYVAVNIKPESEQEKPEVMRRCERERNYFGEMDWQWIQCGKDAFPDVAFSNQLQMWKWMKTRAWDTSMLLVPELSQQVMRARCGLSLASVLSKVSKSMGISINSAYSIFAAAVNLGWLSLDQKKVLRSDRALHLIRPK